MKEFIHETIDFIIWVRFSGLSVTFGLMVEILRFFEFFPVLFEHTTGTCQGVLLTDL